MSQPHRLSVLGSLLAAALVSGCSDGGAVAGPSGPPPVVVETFTIVPAEIRDVVDLVGQLEAEESVLLKSETEGVIAAVEFTEGQEVAAGTLLFRLRDDEQRARLQEAEAAVVLAEEQFSRAHTLAGNRIVSRDELDRTLAANDAAKARRDLARIALARTLIRAPFDGVLGARQVSPGDRIDPDTGLVTIDAVARLRLVFSVPEIAVPLARVGLPLELSVASWPGRTFPGETYFVAPSLDAANRRLLMKALVPNPDRTLRPGMFATIGVEMSRHADALVVPEAALAYDASGPFVWRVDGEQTAARARVTVGVRRDGRVALTDGVHAGDRIVSAGTHKVAPGARIQEATTSPPPT